MNCPNCGLANSAGAKFCANCGTLLDAPSQPFNASQSQYQSPPGYQASAPYQAPSRSSLGKNIGIGCLVVVLIILFLGLSCTRACFGLRHRRAFIHRVY